MQSQSPRPDAGGFSSQAYWEQRYRSGGNSGSGSRGRLAAYKAREVNRLLAEHRIGSVIDFGCGDGRQIGMLDIGDYTGIDVSETAVTLCRSLYADRPGWRFCMARDRGAWAGRYDLAMSLDVVFHLVELRVFEAYMDDLFSHARRLVVIYSSDEDFDAPGEHVLHRRVSGWVRDNVRHWRLAERLDNPFARSMDQPHDRRRTTAHFMVFAPAAADGVAG